MAVSWDTPGYSGEMGRIRGQKGTYYGKYEGLQKDIPPAKRPPLPPTEAVKGSAPQNSKTKNIAF
jgi:hypothetical protein